jgi:hypothetical protein
MSATVIAVTHGTKLSSKQMQAIVALNISQGYAMTIRKHALPQYAAHGLENILRGAKDRETLHGAPFMMAA